MNKTTQNLAWSILPKEFKEEVKKLYVDALDASNSPHDPDDRKWGNYRVTLLEKLFGHNNLTSDAEGEEMLTVSRKRVQEMYAHYDKISNDQNRPKDYIESVYEYADGVTIALDDLFGSKCLPDEKGIAEKANCPETKYHVGQRMYIKYINKIGTIDIVQGYNKEEDGIYYHLKVEPKGVASAREEYLQPYEEPKPAEPKFNVGELCMRDGYVTRVLEYDPKREFPYTIHVLRMNLKTIASESGLEPYTEPTEEVSPNVNNSDIDIDELVAKGYIPDPAKQFDTIPDDNFSKDRRLNIAAMAMRGMLARIDDTPQVIAEIAFRYADALLTEAEKGGKS